MRILTKEVERTRQVRVPGRHDLYISETFTENQLNKFGKSLVWFAGLGIAFGAAKLIVGEDYMDILGDHATEISRDEAQLSAQSKYDGAFTTLSPADKFTVQYAGTTTVRVEKLVGGNGLAGSLDIAVPHEFQFNNGCLENTAYDINGGDLSLDAYGLFFHVSAQANIPTAMAKASVDVSNPDLVHILSGDNSVNTLSFSGVQGGVLTSANENTQRILDTYGCNIGLQA